MDDRVVGTGRSKLVAKRVIAKMMLGHLSARGYKAPAEFTCRHEMTGLMDQAGLPAHSYVVLVRELCKQFRLDPVEYDEFAELAGQPGFTVKARIGTVERIATGSTKRIARDLVAEQIYRHLRTRVHAPNFHEDRVLYRAYEKAMARTSDEETSDEDINNEDTTDEDSSDEDDPLSHREEPQAVAAPRRSLRTVMLKRRGSAAQVALEAAIKLEQEPAEGSSEVSYSPPPRPPRRSPPPSPVDFRRLPPGANPYRPLDQFVAMNFISRTMHRLGI